jgi:hypothetical protein
MRTHPVFDSNGELCAFEVSNALLGAATIGRILRKQLGATITHRPSSFLKVGDVRLEFTLNAIDFVVIEPFGDNSRYWIGPEQGELKRTPAIDAIHQSIARYKPTPLAWIGTFLGANAS